MSRRLGIGLVSVACGALLAGCADTVSPALGGLKLGIQDAPLKPPVRLGEDHPFEYPVTVWRASGTTILKILISAEGTIDSVFVLESSGHPGLDSAALADARKLRYRPAEQGTVPVAIWGRLPVIYPPRETTAGP